MTDVQVTFGADISGLVAGAAQAKAQLEALSAEARRLAQQMIAAGQAGNSQLVSALKSIQTEAASVGSTLKIAESGIAGIGHSAASGAPSLSFFAREARALADELSSGRFRQADGTLVNILGHSSSMISAFAAANPVLTAVGAATAAAAAAMGYFALEGFEAAKATQAIRLDAAAGQMYLTAQQADNLRTQIQELANVSASQAEEIFEPFKQLGEAGGILAKLNAQYIVQIQGTKKLGEAAKEVAEYYTDLSKKGRELVASTDGVTGAQMRLYDTSNDVGKMVMVYDALVARYEKLREATKNETAALVDQQIQMVLNASSDGAFALSQDQISSSVAAATTQIQRQSEAARDNRVALTEAANAQKVFMDGVAEAAKVNHTAREVDELTVSVGKMQAALKNLPAGDTETGLKLAGAIAVAQDKLKGLNQELEAGPGGGNLVSGMKQQFDQIDANWRGSEAARLQTHLATIQQMLAGDKLDDAQRRQLTTESYQVERQIRDAQNESYLRQQEIQIAAAGKSSAQKIAILEGEVKRETDAFGEGSKQQEDALDRLARAKEEAANRGAAAGAKAAKDELGATMQGLQEQIQYAEKTAQDNIRIYELEAKAKQITEAQKLQFTKDALSDERTDVDALYAQELAVGNQTATKLAAIRRQLTMFDLENADKAKDAEVQAAEKTQQAWNSTMNTINGAFTSQISGLLHGTTSWQQATKNVLASLTEDVAKFFVEWGIKAVENEVLQIASQTGVTTGVLAALGIQTAAQSAAAKTGVASQIAADTGEAYAGFAAFFSPTLGPGALGAAAGLAATVSGTAMGMVGAGSVASADIGMFDVPQDMLTLIHRNELVMPAAEAGAFRSMLSGGGGGSDDEAEASNGTADALASVSAALKRIQTEAIAMLGGMSASLSAPSVRNMDGAAGSWAPSAAMALPEPGSWSVPADMLAMAHGGGGPIMPSVAGGALSSMLTRGGGSEADADSGGAGEWGIPSSILEMVHSGGLTMPAAQAGAFRSMLSGAPSGGESGGAGASGGVNVTFAPTVHAIDAAGVQRFLNNYAPQLAKTVRNYQKLNPSTA